MEKSRVGRFITIFAVIMATIEIGIGIGYYMLLNIDFNKYNNDYDIEVIK